MSEKQNPPAGNRGAQEDLRGSAINDTNPSATGNPPALKLQATGRSQNQLVTEATEEYLAMLDPDNPPLPRVIERDLLAKTNFAIGLENTSRKRDNKIALLRTLTISQIAKVMLYLHRVVKIQAGGGRSLRSALVGIYCPTGPDAGIYLCEEDAIRAACRVYNAELTIAGGRELMAIFKESAPWVTENEDKDLIAVNNGIFNYATQELLPFTPDVVFRSKSQVDLDFNAANPVLQMPEGESWDVESWVASLSSDPEIVDLLWEILGAVVRPAVRWNKSAWFFSEKGNNGKGTLVELMRGLCGPGRHVSIPLDQLGKDFMLEQTLNASAIIVDENDVGTFIDKAANLKTIITNDVLMVNRKGLPAVSFRFRGFMVQCLNEYPRTKDKTDSFYRRQLFIPFLKNFSKIGMDGRPLERTCIKEDFVHRPEVLQYVLKKVLVDLPRYYKLSEPDAAMQALSEYKTANNPVRRWWLDVNERFVWDLLSLSFLHDHYKAWLRKAVPMSAGAIGVYEFGDEVLRLVSEFGGWTHPLVEKTRVGKRMDKSEPMIAEYRLEDWVERDKNDRPVWSRQKPAPVNVRWCLVRDGNRKADQEVVDELRRARRAYDSDRASWIEYLTGMGLPSDAAKHHADLPFYNGGCGSGQCPVCSRRPTPEEKVRATVSADLSKELVHAMNQVEMRALDLKAEMHEAAS